jgi:hypothetical protein
VSACAYGTPLLLLRGIMLPRESWVQALSDVPDNLLVGLLAKNAFTNRATE